MAFEHRPNTGMARKNKFKTMDKHPVMKGDGRGECPRCGCTWDIDIGIWRKVDKNGDVYVSLSLDPIEAQEAPPPVEQSPPPDDDIPF